MLEEQMESDYETISLLQAGDQPSDAGDTPALESPEEILTRLQKQIQAIFPKPGRYPADQRSSKSLSSYLSPAFLSERPAMDAPMQMSFYINPSYAPYQTELVTTLAHEGYPGHLYQNSF